MIEDLVEGVLAGLNISSNRTKTEACMKSVGNLEEVKDHDWSTLIQWQHNSVKDIPLVNGTLVDIVVGQLMDDTE